jgi:hypothetical protein
MADSKRVRHLAIKAEVLQLMVTGTKYAPNVIQHAKPA